MRTSGRVRVIGLGLVALLAAPPAFAVDRATSERLKDLETEVVGLGGRVEQTRLNFTERSGLIGVTEARQRYEDAVYLFLIGDYSNAATSFYILVQSRALGNVDLSRDSEWYLAECLFEMENYRTADEAYGAIVAKGPDHPFFADAIRRELEVYGLIGDTEAFDRTYNTYIVSGKVPTTELINYTLSKSFYRRGEYARSKAGFETIPATSPYYTRARYFLGVLMILEKNYAAAIEEYQKVVAIPPADDDARKVNELAQLALARLFYETGDFTQASTWYGKIDKDSPWFADQLYESVWSFIKQENWTEARSQVDIFLTVFPEHRYAASLRLLKAHLHMKTAAFDDARADYEGVVEDYTPMMARIEGMSAGTQQLKDFLAGLEAPATESATRLPGFAQEMLLSRDDVSRATGAWSEISRQEDELEASEQMVKDLTVALAANTNVLGSFVAARSDITGVRATVLALRDRLLEGEGAYLRTRVASAVRPEIAGLQKERATVLADLAEADQGAGQSSDRLQVYDEQVREVQQRAFRVAQIAQEAQAMATATMSQLSQSKLSPAEAAEKRSELEAQQAELARLTTRLQELQGEVVRRQVVRTVEEDTSNIDGGSRDAVVRRYEDLRRRTASYRTSVTESDASSVFAQFDRVWSQVEQLEKSADETARVLSVTEAKEMTAVRSRLTSETARVRELRSAIDAQTVEAESLA